MCRIQLMVLQNKNNFYLQLIGAVERLKSFPLTKYVGFCFWKKKKKFQIRNTSSLRSPSPYKSPLVKSIYFEYQMIILTKKEEPHSHYHSFNYHIMNSTVIDYPLSCKHTKNRLK